MNKRSKSGKIVLLIALLAVSLVFNFGCSKKSGNPDKTKYKHVKTIINPKDGAEMVYVYPGVFYMGASPHDRLADVKEKPLRKIYLEGFYIYKHEVTIRQFKKFTDETGYKTLAERKNMKFNWRLNLKKNRMDHPVSLMAYEDAEKYAQWAGGSLPSEAQWEKAAKGNDVRIYPWGDRMNLAYFNNDVDPEFTMINKKDPPNAEDDFPRGFTKKVGSYPEGASPYGVMDMMGNVFEFTRDWYALYPKGYSNFAVYEPPTPKQGDYKIIKGGGNCDVIMNYRISSRDMTKTDVAEGDFGFRLAMKKLPDRKKDKNQSIQRRLQKENEILVNLKDGAYLVLMPSKGRQSSRTQDEKIIGVYLRPVDKGRFDFFLHQAPRPHSKIPIPFKGESGPAKMNLKQALTYCKWAGGGLPTNDEINRLKRLIRDTGDYRIRNIVPQNSVDLSTCWTKDLKEQSQKSQIKNRYLIVCIPEENMQ